LVALTFFQSDRSYVYVEMGNRKYCTIELQKKPVRKRSKSRGSKFPPG